MAPRKGGQAWVEFVTNAFAFITTDHALIHEGQAFSSTGVMSTIANGQVGAIMFKTPATGYVHFKAAAIRSNAAVSVSMLKNYVETEGDNVAALPAINRNHNSNNEAASLLKAGVNIVALAEDDPITIATAYVGANLPAYRVGGDITQAEEMVLAQGTNYMIAISNSSGNPATVSYDLLWYEEDAA